MKKILYTILLVLMVAGTSYGKVGAWYAGGGGSGTGDVSGVGDCADGACLDGSSDGGQTISLYDGNSHKGIFDVPDIAEDVTYTFPATTGTIENNDQ